MAIDGDTERRRWRPGEALLAAMRRHGTGRRLDAGERLFATGEAGRSFFLLEEGTVRLEFPERAEPVRLGPVAVFGELGLILEDHRRTAAAVAETPVGLVEIDTGALPALVRECPEEMVAMLRSTAAYLLRSEQALTDALRRRQRELETTLDYLRRTREELDSAQIAAMTDPLTGLYNRRCFIRNIEQAEALGRRAAILLVDLDRFKEVNDVHGHQAGDAVLCHVASVLQSTARSTDLPCRVGGDEFAVLMPDAGREECLALADRILRTLAGGAVRHEGLSIAIGCSLGGAALEPGGPWKAAYERADEALYRSKRAGRGTVHWQD